MLYVFGDPYVQYRSAIIYTEITQVHDNFMQKVTVVYAYQMQHACMRTLVRTCTCIHNIMYSTYNAGYSIIYKLYIL